MAQEIPETTYVPEVEEDARKERERRAVEEGTELWRRRKEELLRQKQQEQRELQKIVESYSPWGKPGGGAPCAATLRKKNVPLEPLEPIKSQTFDQGWTNDTTIERLYRRSVDPLAATNMNKFFDDKSEPGIARCIHSIEDSKNRCNEEVQVYELTGGVELVPLLTSRRYYTQPQSTRYIATDATRPGYAIESMLLSRRIPDVRQSLTVRRFIRRKRIRGDLWGLRFVPRADFIRDLPGTRKLHKQSFRLKKCLHQILTGT